MNLSWPEFKPLADVVVTLLPDHGGTGVWETDQEGNTTPQFYGTPGLMPGDFKMAISDLISVDREPQGLGPRSAIFQPPAVMSAKEQLPSKSSDLGRTKLSASVGTKGEPLPFNIDAPLELAGKTKASSIEGNESTVASPTAPAKVGLGGAAPEEPARPGTLGVEPTAPTSPHPCPGRRIGVAVTTPTRR